LKLERTTFVKKPKQGIESSGNDSDSDVESQAPETGDSGAEDDDGPESYTVPVPKAREAGDTPYVKEQVHPNTLLFLKDLKANNNRDWLKCKCRFSKCKIEHRVKSTI
jgi:hypothetical protein